MRTEDAVSRREALRGVRKLPGKKGTITPPKCEKVSKKWRKPETRKTSEGRGNECQA